jgi:transposase-like protein
MPSRTRAAGCWYRGQRSPSSGRGCRGLPAFAKRELSEYELAYLFVDGIAERLRAGAKREPVLAAWGYTVDGRRALLHLMAGSKEDAETVIAFFEDMKGRGLKRSAP